MNKLLTDIPKVDEFLISKNLLKHRNSTPYTVLINSIRESIDIYRKKILNNELEEFIVDRETLKIEIINKIIDLIESKGRLNLKNVINATGTIIHTNLGRSKLMKSCGDNILKVANNYNNLEYNIESGKRGIRYSHIESLICEITGAESALVVNNNAAAVLLTLDTITKNSEVIVSRGELVEIGGSFRIPTIMEYSGSKLVEVGTTNRTHIKDYVDAITEETGALLKVHTSNYKIIGFTKDVNIKEIVEIAKEKKLITIEDLGSGVLIDFSKYGYKKEPTVQDSIKAGIDIVTFSGDKLLGGPQAGIIVGKKEYIDQMKKNNLLRTLRVSKLIIAALEVTLREYQNEKEAIENIPTLKMILENREEVKKRAMKLHDKLTLIKNLDVNMINTQAIVGGGAMPNEFIDSFGVAINSEHITNITLEKKLRNNLVPIISRIQNEKVVLDCKTLTDDDIDIIYKILFKGFDII